MTYDEHRTALIQYLKAKVDICDWHGVSDAANDLRVLEAQEEAKRGTKADPRVEELRHALEHIQQCDESRLCSDCRRLVARAISGRRE